MGLNDPQWGNRNSGGPPDLEAVLRDLNKRIASLFGIKTGGPGGPTGGGNNVSPARKFGGAGLVVVIAILIWIASGFYIVDASQRGVVLRFGKYIGATEPGPRWHLPFPIETVEVVNLSQVRTAAVGYRDNVKNKVLKESLMLTDDENIIDIQFAVQYFLKDPADYLFNNREPDENVRQAAETAIREVVGKNKMDFVLYEGREEVAAATTKLIQDILDRYKSGILVSKVTMQNAQPPEQVQAAFEDTLKAGQDGDRLKKEGLAYASDVIPKAQGTSARLREEAEGYKSRVIAQAQGDGQRFSSVLTEYQKAPLVTRDRLYIDAMRDVYSNVTKVLVDSRNNSNLLYLPLDKLIQQSGATAPAVAPVIPAATDTPPPAAVDVRARDSQRSRDGR